MLGAGAPGLALGQDLPCGEAFGEPLTIGGPPMNLVAAADLDGDGDVDALGATQNAVWWFPNAGDGTFEPGLELRFLHGDGLAVSVGWLEPVDLDGDTDLDLLVSDARYSEVAWFENLGGPAETAFAPSKRLLLVAGSATRVSAPDLDGDGDRDLVLLGNLVKPARAENLGQLSFGAIEVLRWDPDGTIGGLAVEDFDGDGILDLASIGFGDDAVLWFEGGATGFAPPAEVGPAPGNAMALQASDLDEDGDSDLLLGSSLQTGWYENVGGSFAVLKPLLPGRFSWALRAIDLDGDGDSDLLSSGSQNLAWSENLGGMQFSAVQPLAPGYAVPFDVADFDGDGLPDLLFEQGGLHWRPNRLPVQFDSDGDGVCDPDDLCKEGSDALDPDADGIPSACDACLWVDDSDGDGVPDDCDRCPDGPDGDDADLDGVCAPSDLCIGDDAQGDSDGDGDCDDRDLCLGLGDDSDGDGVCDTLDVCPDFPDDHDEDRDGVPDRCDPCPDSPGALDSDGDFVCDSQDQCFGEDDALDDDADGVPDACDDCPGLTNPAQGAPWGEPRLIDPELYGAALTPSDLDGDGDLDLLAVQGGLCWLENLGGRFDLRRLLDLAATGPAEAADLDGDGDLDLLAGAGERAAWYENLGDRRFAAPLAIGTWSDRTARRVWADDLDGDGDSDVLALYGGQRELRLYENLGAGNFGPEMALSTVPDELSDGFSADLDGDGDRDVVTVSLGGDLAWYANDGAFSFGGRQLVSDTVGQFNDTQAADLDGDGDLDLLVGSSSLATISWYANDGGGVFGPEQLVAPGDVSALAATDTDGDADLDLVIRTPFQVLALENLGIGTFGQPAVVYFSADDSLSLPLVPLDLDGDLDDDLVVGTVTGLYTLENALPVPPDSDGDGLCDASDPCVGAMDQDSDGDSLCDDLDTCEGFDDALDSDGDGSADGCDRCEGDDLAGDIDQDGVCLLALDGTVLDCDDHDPERHPGAIERCNGLDDDCDGTSDPSTCAPSEGPEPGSPDSRQPAKEGGCGCSSTGPSASLPWLLALLGLRKRRSSR